MWSSGVSPARSPHATAAPRTLLRLLALLWLTHPMLTNSASLRTPPTLAHRPCTALSVACAAHPSAGSGNGEEGGADVASSLEPLCDDKGGVRVPCLVP
jgi:hypothetical protein